MSGAFLTTPELKATEFKNSKHNDSFNVHELLYNVFQLIQHFFLDTEMSRSSSPSKRASSQVGDDINDRLEDLKKRFHLLEGDRKAYFETTQWTIQHNKERISALRAENRDILANMTELQRAVQEQMEGNNEADRMVWQIREIRKKHDEVKHKLDEKQKYLEKLRDDQRALEMETPSPDEENSSLVLNMKNLDNRLEKTAIRQNEVCAYLTGKEFLHYPGYWCEAHL